MKNIKIKAIILNNKPVWMLSFPFDREVISMIKTINGARWNPQGRYWHIPSESGSVTWLNHVFSGRILFVEETGNELNVKPLSSGENLPSKPVIKVTEDGHGRNRIIDEFVKSLILKQYSRRTIETYTSMFRLFLNYFRDRDIQSISDEEIRDYLLYLIDEKKVSLSYQNQAINAVKYYYEHVLGRSPKTYYLARPKPAIRYPTVLSEEEVAEILSRIGNLKHRMVIALIYSSGLRISEAINLRLEDIDSRMGYIVIKGGKGKKDRRTLLSKSLLENLRAYYKIYRPVKWVFEGQGGRQYSDESIQSVLRKAVSQAGIRKHVTVHTLRHSFATHLLEHGVNLRYIQTLLGHSSSRTTEIYTHVTNKGLFDIKSPLDNLGLK